MGQVFSTVKPKTHCTLFILLYFSDLAPMPSNSSNNVVQLKEVIVAMVPFADYSHLNNLFDLARFIASHNIPVHFLCFADRNQALKLRLQGGLGASNIHFDDLLLPSSSPTENDDAGCDSEPAVLMFLKEVKEPIHKKCLELSTNTKRLVIIHDLIMSEHIQDAHTLPNVKSYIFHTGSTFSRYSCLQQIIPDIADDDHDKLVEQMQGEFPLLEPHVKSYFRMECLMKLQSGEIIHSFKEMEGKYPDLLANAKDKPLWAFGPFHMLLETHDSISSSSSNMTSHECLKFLDKQDVNSVIFVSFGSTTTLSQEQLNELALGLERCNHRFIWVLRKGDDVRKLKDKDEKIELPEGFKKRVEGRGMVVSWAPQQEILGHSSTGGFLSHCGWSSCIESISMGVPLATWPITYDQPYNAVFVTKLLKIGISVKSWAHRDELVTASTIEKAVKTLMGTTEGEDMRQRAVELSKKIKSSVSQGGPARKRMESFISNIIK